MLTDDEIYYLGSIQISDDLFAQKKIYALADELKRLRAELARYQTPNVDNVTIKGE